MKLLTYYWKLKILKLSWKFFICGLIPYDMSINISGFVFYVKNVQSHLLHTSGATEILNKKKVYYLFASPNKDQFYNKANQK